MKMRRQQVDVAQRFSSCPPPFIYMYNLVSRKICDAAMEKAMGVSREYGLRRWAPPSQFLLDQLCLYVLKTSPAKGREAL